MRARARWAVLLALVLGLGGAALATPRARLTLQDGSVVEGELESFEGGVYTLTIAGRSLTFAEREVSRIEVLGAAAAEPPRRTDLAAFDRHRVHPRDRWQVQTKAGGEVQGLTGLSYEYTFEEQVLEADGEGRPARRERTYQVFRDSRLQGQLPLEGRALLLQRDPGSGKTLPSGKEGWELPAFLRERLEEELNEAASYSPDAWRPAGPVLPGEEWELPRAAVGFLLGREIAEAFAGRAVARFEGLEERPEGVWASVVFTVQGKWTLEGQEVELELKSTVRAPLDGRTSAREEQASMRAGPQTRVEWTWTRTPLRRAKRRVS